MGKISSHIFTITVLLPLRLLEPVLVFYFLANLMLSLVPGAYQKSMIDISVPENFDATRLGDWTSLVVNQIATIHPSFIIASLCLTAMIIGFAGPFRIYKNIFIAVHKAEPWIEIDDDNHLAEVDVKGMTLNMLKVFCAMTLFLLIWAIFLTYSNDGTVEPTILKLRTLLNEITIVALVIMFVPVGVCARAERLINQALVPLQKFFMKTSVIELIRVLVFLCIGLYGMYYLAFSSLFGVLPTQLEMVDNFRTLASNPKGLPIASMLVLTVSGFLALALRARRLVALSPEGEKVDFSDVLSIITILSFTATVYLSYVS